MGEPTSLDALGGQKGPPKSKKILIVLSILLVSLLLIAGGLYYYTSNEGSTGLSKRERDLLYIEPNSGSKFTSTPALTVTVDPDGVTRRALSKSGVGRIYKTGYLQTIDANNLTIGVGPNIITVSVPSDVSVYFRETQFSPLQNSSLNDLKIGDWISITYIENESIVDNVTAIRRLE